MHGAANHFAHANVANQILLASAARTSTGTGDAVTDLGEWRTLTLQLDVTANSPTAAPLAVASNADDGTDDGTTLVANGTTLSVGVPATDATDAIFRFTGVAIPQGAVITSAVLTLRRTANDIGSVPVTLDCIDADNQAFPANHAAYAALTHTAGTSDTISGGTSGADYVSDDFAADVQTVVDRVGWASGNALVVCVRDDGAANGNQAQFEAFDNVASNPATLTITFEPRLNVYVQTTIDGSNWVDVAHFTEVAGDGSAVRQFAKLIWDAALTEFENGTALAGGAVPRHHWRSIPHAMDVERRGLIHVQREGQPRMTTLAIIAISFLAGVAVTIAVLLAIAWFTDRESPPAPPAKRHGEITIRKIPLE